MAGWSFSMWPRRTMECGKWARLCLSRSSKRLIGLEATDNLHSFIAQSALWRKEKRKVSFDISRMCPTIIWIFSKSQEKKSQKKTCAYHNIAVVFSVVENPIKNIIISSLHWSMKHTKSSCRISGFTLVELIVGITILAILATISTVMLMNYFWDARDSARVSDINSISKALVLYQTKTGNFPTPTNTKTVKYGSGEVWKQGTIWQSVFQALAINKIPLDPRFDAEYSYSVTQDGKSYQLAGVAESDIIAARNSTTNTAYAEKLTAIVKWNYNGLVAKAIGDGFCKVIALPSITLAELPSNTDTIDLLSVWSGQLAFMKKENLPASYAWKLPSGVELAWRFLFRDYKDNQADIEFPCDIIGSKVISQEELQLKLNSFVTQLGSFYGETPIAADPNYSTIVNTKWGQASDKILLG